MFQIEMKGWSRQRAVLLALAGAIALGSVVCNAQATANTELARAEAGDAEAQFQLGNRLSHFVNFDGDVDYYKRQGIDWLRKAARQGHQGARLRLAQIAAVEKNKGVKAGAKPPTQDSLSDAPPANRPNSVRQKAPSVEESKASETDWSKFTVIESQTPTGGADVASQQPDRPGRDVVGLVVSWLLLISGLVGYFKMLAVEKKAALESAPLPTDKLVGIHGWLKFFVISLGVLGPALSLGKVGVAFRDDEMIYAALMHSSEWSTYKTTVWLTLAVFLAFSIYAALKLRFVWKPSSVTLAKIALASWPVASLLMGLVFPMMIFPGQSTLDTKFVGSFLALIVSTVVWIAYLSKSKRVRATYYGSITGTQQPNSETSGPTVPKQTLSVDFATPVPGADNAVSSRKVEQEDKPYEALATPTPEIEVNSPREEYWSTALTEFDSPARRPGLWARAFAEAQGNEAVAKANYLRYRASELEEAHQLQVAERQRELAREALLTAQGTCPNKRCRAVIPLSSQDCPKCGAFFETGSTWSVQPLET